jgi:hypothetical protein
MTDNDDGVITRLAIRHSVSPEAVRTILRALRSGNGMAQFSHPDFGGMSQWSGGMTMVGDMFNSELKAKLDDICTELASYLAKSGASQKSGHGGDPGVSYRSNATTSDWWPAGLGTPASVGAQNDLRYAVFPDTRRLAIKDGRHVDVYDTGDHRIFGVAQSQSTDQTLTFTSQTGLVRVADLPKVKPQP